MTEDTVEEVLSRSHQRNNNERTWSTEAKLGE